MVKKTYIFNAGIISALHNVICVILLVTLLSSCHSHSSRNGNIIHLHYASYLRMQQHNGYISAEIINPWDTTRTLHKYILVGKKSSLPSPMPEGTLVRTPLCHTIVYSSVHCSLLNEWGKLYCIAGVCDLNYIMMSSIHKRFQEGKLIDTGNSMMPDAEKIIAINPDAILLSPYKDNGGYGKLDKSGIPIIECADYMETSPLGRAEWMKFYGILYGCEPQADSMFKKIEKEYLSYKSMALKTKIKTRPTVFTDMKNGATWMIPGGNSTIGIFMHDAGAKYLFADRTKSGSISISPEEVLDRCHNADFWLIKYNSKIALNYNSLLSLDPIYSQFNAVKKHKVFCCNTGVVPFYEDAPFHPERLLKDMIKIFHPEILKEYKSKYYIAL
jgi:iron complex transport system substrate-binding protein